MAEEATTGCKLKPHNASVNFAKRTSSRECATAHWRRETPRKIDIVKALLDKRATYVCDLRTGYFFAYRSRERADVMVKERESVQARLLSQRNIDPVLVLPGHGFVCFVVTNPLLYHYYLLQRSSFQTSEARFPDKGCMYIYICTWIHLRVT